MKKSETDKNQTGIAGELLVAGELARRCYDVSITFGTTKSIDLFIYKNDKQKAIQVKAIHNKSANWNVKPSFNTTINPDLYIVLVNLNDDNLDSSPDFYILTYEEAVSLFNFKTKNDILTKRPWLSCSSKLQPYKNQWSKIQ